jgi:hypothetical protein
MRGLDAPSRFIAAWVRTSTRFESVGTEGKDLRGEAGLEEHGLVGRYSGRLRRRSHRHSPSRSSRLIVAGFRSIEVSAQISLCVLKRARLN